MAGLEMWTPELGDNEFVGYTFNGSPERRARLWFLDRHLELLFRVEGWTIGDIDAGTWSAGFQPVRGVLCRVLRYEHHGTKPWTAVWRLTDTVIPHVHTFGRDDDVWRLGLWPD